jgi:2'-5' RNA ligase
MFNYAADTTRWEEWQEEYRYGAFYIFPPSGVIEAIDALRRQYDPLSAAICQAHISLTEPLADPLTATQITELRSALSALPAFELTYGPLRSFPPYPGVVYAIQPEADLQRLRSRLHSTSPFAGSALKRRDIATHMTIAEFITVERTAELLKTLQGRVPEGAFRCSAIEYAVPNDAFHFERVLTLPLGPGEADSSPARA